MSNRIKIKVIKKGDVKIVENHETAEKQTEPDNSSNLSSTVSNWIDEFRERRREETETARQQFNS